MKFLLDKATGILHDHEHLREECNTDDIRWENREYLTVTKLLDMVHSLDEARHLHACQHCAERPSMQAELTD